MEAISMKCTREQYESMRQELLTAKVKESSQLFDFYENSNIYLTNDYGGDELFFTCCVYDRKVYKTFDKDIFLKACGIDPNKFLFENVTEYFKDAVDCVSVIGSKFNMKDYDLNSLHVDDNCVFIKNKNGEEDKWLYCLDTKQYAKIVTTTSKLKIPFNPSKDLLKDAIWAGGSSVTPEILRELTEPKNKAKRLKVGGIYKGKETATHFSALIKITKDDGNEIWAYGFHNGKFDGKNEAWYGGEGVDRAIARLKETTIEKWEKALLKYKK